MKSRSANLARTITRNSSKQSYLIACLLADKALVDDCLRAYAYFRWADDVIDLFTESQEERLAFIEGQKELVRKLYMGERPGELRPEEEMIADLIAHDRRENNGLQSFIHNFMAVLEFDAVRKGRPITGAELSWYSACLGKAVTNAIQYFIGNDHPYPDNEKRYLAATAAHITHMLRDLQEDVAEGYFNIPEDWLVENGFDGLSLAKEQRLVQDPAFRMWVRDRVQLAQEGFREGKQYLDELEGLRCQIAGYWYCARFECVLEAIQQDNYILQQHYNQRRKIGNKLKFGWLGLSLSVGHATRRLREALSTVKRKPSQSKDAASQRNRLLKLGKG